MKSLLLDTVRVPGQSVQIDVSAVAEYAGPPGPHEYDNLGQGRQLQGVFPRSADRDRAAIRAAVERPLGAVAAERGPVLNEPLREHDRRSLARLAVQRTFQACLLPIIRQRGKLSSGPQPWIALGSGAKVSSGYG